jgi:hypothetical protein
MAKPAAERQPHPNTAAMREMAANRMLTRPDHSCGVMDPAAIASALIAARVGQAQMAAAARMMRNAQSADAAVIQQLLAAANQSGEKLAAAVQQGMGELVDIAV